MIPLPPFRSYNQQLYSRVAFTKSKTIKRVLKEYRTLFESFVVREYNEHSTVSSIFITWWDDYLARHWFPADNGILDRVCSVIENQSQGKKGKKGSKRKRGGPSSKVIAAIPLAQVPLSEASESESSQEREESVEIEVATEATLQELPKSLPRRTKKEKSELANPEVPVFPFLHNFTN